MMNDSIMLLSGQMGDICSSGVASDLLLFRCVFLCLLAGE
jgi:hypothetical protein